MYRLKPPAGVYSKGSAHAADPIFNGFFGFSDVRFFVIFLLKMGPGGPGRGLKSFLEVVRFILTEYEPVGSHGDPVHDNFYRFLAHIFHQNVRF